VALTQTSDRACLPLVACGTDEYEQVAPTPTSNRVCKSVYEQAWEQQGT
jgi:hypothetical protein